eukprot:2652915-Rhodomonas_salina.2
MMTSIIMVNLNATSHKVNGARSTHQSPHGQSMRPRPESSLCLTSPVYTHPSAHTYSPCPTPKPPTSAAASCLPPLTHHTARQPR